MSIEIDGVKYSEALEVAKRLNISRQTLWRWRKLGRIPPGLLYRGRQVVFSPDDIRMIEEFANRIETIGNSDSRQLRLFNGVRSKS